MAGMRSEELGLGDVTNTENMNAERHFCLE
jgi:hypothetical protein